MMNSIFNLTTFAFSLSYFYGCGSADPSSGWIGGSILRMWIHKVPPYGSNLVLDSQFTVCNGVTDAPFMLLRVRP